MDLNTLSKIAPYLNLSKLSRAIGQGRATLASRIKRGGPELTVKEAEKIKAILRGEVED